MAFVIITMGGNGAVYNNGMEIIRKPVPDVDAVDITAAGDAFSGAVAAALSMWIDPDVAVDFANKAGTLTAMKKGAQISLPNPEEVQSYNFIQITQRQTNK